MKVKFIEISFIVLILVALSGCGHQHSFIEATCIEPKTCSICGSTEGEALGHTWLEVDCDSPKTCSVCGSTEGEALGHTWLEADCDSPKACSTCGLTEGEALGHMVEVGLCDRCKTIQNEDLLLEIASCFTVAGEASNTILSLITSANTSSLNDVYTKINQAQSYLGIVTSNMQDIYDLCEGYSDLHNIQNQAKYMLDVIPEKIAGNDRNSIIASLSDYASFMRQVETTYNKWSEYISQLA